MSRHCLLMALMALFCSPAETQARGHIAGIVLDENDQLVSDATLCLATKSGNNTQYDCNARSDGSGNFDIPNVKNGLHNVFALYDKEGYSFWTQTPGQEVVLTPENQTPRVTVHLQTPGGIVFASVSDKLTGQPLRDGWATAYDVSGRAWNGAGVLVNGKLCMAVPVDSDLVVIVSAKGYKGWVFSDPSNPSRPVLRLHSGERKILDVELEPDPDVNK